MTGMPMIAGRPMYWKLLPDHSAAPATHDEFGAMFNDPAARIVHQDHVGKAFVSTVFLGLDHNWSGVGPPLLFETMVFGLPDSEPQWRYATWDDAVAGHARVLEAVKAGRDPYDD